MGQIHSHVRAQLSLQHNPCTCSSARRCHLLSPQLFMQTTRASCCYYLVFRWYTSRLRHNTTTRVRPFLRLKILHIRIHVLMDSAKTCTARSWFRTRCIPIRSSIESDTGQPCALFRPVPPCMKSCIALLAYVNPTHCNGRRGRETSSISTARSSLVTAAELAKR